MAGRWIHGLAWVLAVAAAAGFFLPWLKTGTPAERSGRAARTAVAELTDAADRPWWEIMFGLRTEERKQALERPWQGISGYDLLADLRHGKARRHDEADKIFFINTDSFLARGLLIYAIPASALLAACCVSLLRRPAWLILLPLLGTGLVYGVVRAKINDTFFERLVNGVGIGPGLWLSLYALLGLSVLLCIHWVRTALSK